MSRGLKWILGIVVGNFVLAMLGFALPFTLMLYLVGGWVLFLVRNFKETTLSPTGIATAAIAVAIFVAMLHWLLTWFHAAWTKPQEPSAIPAGSASPMQWRFAWTLAVTGLILLMFVAGTAMIGLTHQIVWVATAKEPIIQNSGGIREISYRNASQNNLKQIGLGLNNVADKEKSLPAGGTCDANGRMMHGWQTQILAEVEEGPLHKRVDFNRPWNDPANAEVFKTPVYCYINPSRNEVSSHDAAGYAISTYAGNVHVLGGTRRWKLDEITDGTSKTILAGEVKSEFKPWGSPTNWRDPQDGLNKSPSGFGGPWQGGMTNLLMVDGSVHAINEDIDPAVLKALSTPAAGDEVKVDY